MSKRDEDAWRMFMAIYQPLVRYWCRRAGIRDNDLDDVTQEVFSSVSRSIGRFQKVRKSDTFRGWLRTIARKRVADFIRSAQSVDVTVDEHCLRGMAAEGNSSDDSVDDVNDPESRQVSREMLHRAIESVSEGVEHRTWQAFWRTAVDDQPGPAVAEELGMTPEAVRKAKSRMVARLRLVLGSLLFEIARDAGVDLSP